MIQVRRYTYRGVAGYKVCGYPSYVDRYGNVIDDNGGWPLAIFVRHRLTALAIKRAECRRSAAWRGASGDWWRRVIDGLIQAERVIAP